MNSLLKIQKESFAKWKADGAENLRQEYPDLDIGRETCVIDLGAYKGNWAALILEKYPNAHYIGFEPIKSIYDNLVEYMKLYSSRTTLYNLATGNSNKEILMQVSGVGSSAYKNNKYENNENFDKCQMIRFSDFIGTHMGIVDLLKINIEGGEFEVLPDLILRNQITQFKNIQVQFHPFVEGAEDLYRNIRYELEKTHHLTYEYPWIWENWKLNESI